jgi:hypothetical protein
MFHAVSQVPHNHNSTITAQIEYLPVSVAMPMVARSGCDIGLLDLLDELQVSDPLIKQHVNREACCWEGAGIM